MNLLREQEPNVIICGHETILVILFHEITEVKLGFQEFNEMKMPNINCVTYKDNGRVKFFTIK